MPECGGVYTSSKSEHFALTYCDVEEAIRLCVHFIHLPDGVVAVGDRLPNYYENALFLAHFQIVSDVCYQIYDLHPIVDGEPN